jgi:hypothetical protein
MDSRNSVYGAELYLAHRDAMREDTPFRRELLARVGAILILRPNELRDRRDLIEHLQRARTWELVHATDRSLLFVRTPPRALPAPSAGAPAQRRRPDSP